MSQSVFEASGHLTSFADPIIQCKNCKSTSRADRLISEKTKIEIPESADLLDFDKAISENNLKCPSCQGDFEAARKFNMMFKVGIGPDGDSEQSRHTGCYLDNHSGIITLPF